MFVNLQEDLMHPDVMELLSLCVFPDPDELLQAVASYETNSNMQLYGLVSEQEELIGIIGYEYADKDAIQLHHLAVRLERRGEGFARGLILELIAQEQPRLIFAYTHEEALDFFRNVGFTIEGIGETAPGVERFKCYFEPIYENE